MLEQTTSEEELWLLRRARTNLSSLSLEDDEPQGLSLDDEPEEKFAYVLRLFPDSPYAKVPFSLLKGKVVMVSELSDPEDYYYKVIKIVEYDNVERHITVIEVEG